MRILLNLNIKSNIQKLFCIMTAEIAKKLMKYTAAMFVLSYWDSSGGSEF